MRGKSSGVEHSVDNSFLSTNCHAILNISEASVILETLAKTNKWLTGDR